MYLTERDVNCIMNYFGDFVNDIDLCVDYFKDVLIRVYNENAHKLKDSHRAILKHKLGMKGFMDYYQIADKFGIPLDGIESRWNQTVRPKLERYVRSVLLKDFNHTMYELNRTDIIAVCDLSKRGVDMLDWFGIDNYDKLKKFVDSYQPDVFERTSGTNFGITTYRELIVAEALIRKEFKNE